MNKTEFFLCIVCPAMTLGMTCFYMWGYYWRSIAHFWRDQALNQRRTHPLQHCIRRASMKHGRFNP